MLKFTYTHSDAQNTSLTSSEEIQNLNTLIKKNKDYTQNKITKSDFIQSPVSASDDSPSGLDSEEPGHTVEFMNAMKNNDLKYELTFDDILDPEDRARTEQVYADFKAKGYFEQSPEELEDIFRTMHSPDYYDTKFTQLEFEPSNTGKILQNEYKYIGYSYPRYMQQFPKDTKTKHLIRSYEKNGHRLVVSEYFVNGSARFLPKAYVTHHINGYPGIFYKVGSSESAERLYVMDITNPQYSYLLYVNANNTTSKDAEMELHRIAVELFDVN